MKAAPSRLVSSRNRAEDCFLHTRNAIYRLFVYLAHAVPAKRVPLPTFAEDEVPVNNLKSIFVTRQVEAAGIAKRLFAQVRIFECFDDLA